MRPVEKIEDVVEKKIPREESGEATADRLRNIWEESINSKKIN